MAKRFSILLLGMCIFAFADTIGFRNGAKVTGVWLGADADTVRFRMNGQEHVYSRADVAGVTFGSKPPPAAASTPANGSGAPAPSSLAERPQQPQPSNGPEPELLGIIYFRDETGALKSLESGALVAPRANPLRPAYYYLVQGSKSPVRLRRGQKMFFVVRLANGVDPSKFKLYALESKKNSRRLSMAPNGKGALLTIRVNITSLGGPSYGLAPAQELAAGEYCFSPTDSNDDFCFGVD